MDSMRSFDRLSLAPRRRSRSRCSLTATCGEAAQQIRPAGGRISRRRAIAVRPQRPPPATVPDASSIPRGPSRTATGSGPCWDARPAVSCRFVVNDGSATVIARLRVSPQAHVRAAARRSMPNRFFHNSQPTASCHSTMASQSIFERIGGRDAVDAVVSDSTTAYATTRCSNRTSRKPTWTSSAATRLSSSAPMPAARSTTTATIANRPRGHGDHRRRVCQRCDPPRSRAPGERRPRRRRRSDSHRGRRNDRRYR